MSAKGMNSTSINALKWVPRNKCCGDNLRMQPNLGAYFSYSSVFIYNTNYNSEEIPTRENKHCKRRGKEATLWLQTEKASQTQELTSTVILFSFEAPITYLRRGLIKGKWILRMGAERVNSVSISEEPYQNSGLTWTLAFFSF